ncbi:CKS-domain-containing protein [Neocallimastix lanati (nom. inval.)]|nr:CKS-domain-containing protein [Neocallimastix sp. JGI-2020a]
MSSSKPTDEELEMQKMRDIKENIDKIFYSDRYYDDVFEYRHVVLPKQIARWLPPKKILSEEEWRSFGVRQSLGWEHYMIHAPEPHILLFRREKDYQKKYGNNLKPTNTNSIGGMAG